MQVIKPLCLTEVMGITTPPGSLWPGHKHMIFFGTSVTKLSIVEVRCEHADYGNPKLERE